MKDLHSPVKTKKVKILNFSPATTLLLKEKNLPLDTSLNIINEEAFIKMRFPKKSVREIKEALKRAE